MEQYLLKLDTNETYNRLRFKASQWLHDKGLLNDERRKGLLRFNNALKSALAHQQNMFEGMNIRYFGPFDGNNVEELVRILRQLKDMKGPKLLHLHTKKGKGYDLLRRVRRYGMLLVSLTQRQVSVLCKTVAMNHLSFKMYLERRY